MGPLTHHEIVKKAISISDTCIAEIIKRQKEWLNFVGYWRANDYKAGVAGLPDCVMEDFLYQGLPRSIWIIRLLIKEILSSLNSDLSKTSFLIQLVCHYLTDTPWIGHRIGRFFKNDKVKARKIHDDLEIRADKLVSQFFEGIKYLGKEGYWTNFWYSLFKAEAKSEELVNNIDNDKIVQALLKENLIDCLKIYESFLRYIDFRRKVNLSPEIIDYSRKVLSSSATHIYPGKDGLYLQNAKIIALHFGLTYSCNPENFLSIKPEEANIVLVFSKNNSKIECKNGKIFLIAKKDAMGNLTDLFLDLSEASFGTEMSRTHINKWPGKYFLKWDGQKIRENILTKEFYDKFIEATKDVRFRSEKELEYPEKALPEARVEIKSFLREEEDFWRRFNYIFYTCSKRRGFYLLPFSSSSI